MCADVVLAGVDGSPNAQLAVEVAISEATARGWPLRLVSAYPVPNLDWSGMAPAAVPDYADTVRAAVGAMLEEVADYARSQGADVETELEPGNASSMLIEKSRDAGLAVIGARGRGGFVGRLLGSVAAALPSHAACPVIVVPQAFADRQESSTTAVETRGVGDYSGRVVVGIDPVGTSNPALLEAAALAHQRNLPLSVAAVMTVDFGHYAWSTVSSNAGQIASEVKSTIRECIDAVNTAYPGLDVAPRILTSETHDRPSAVVLAEVSVTAEMVVVGSRGRGGFTGLLLGSTSQTLLNHAKGPVMVVRH